jgi:subtilisin-like proprotein convertase family protein
MTLIHNASTTLPNSNVAFDIPFSGGGFAYTGGALYVAYDWGPYAGTLSTVATVSCNSTGVVSRERQANSAAATLGALSNFGPETRLTATVADNDASVVYVISLGSLAQPLVGPQTVQAVVTNRGAVARTNLAVTFDLTGAETFSNTQNVASLAACGGTTTVTFAPFTPSAIGSDTVTVSVPADDVNGNNSKSRPLNETFNLYSYKHPGTTAAGGVGVNANTADFVAKFTTTVAAKVSAINLEFPAVTATTYRVAIYPDSGSGTPGLVPLYQDAADRTIAAAGPVTITLPSPIAVGPGNFYAGIQQTNTTNAGLSFDTEVPIRAGAFYLAVPHPATAWIDFAPGNNFKLNIGVTLVQCSTVAECNDNNACTDDACTNNLCTHVNNNSTSCDGNPCSNPDQCLNGTCIPGPNPCNDNDACTVDLCDGQGGCIYNPLDCNDNNACTDDSCVPASGCAHSNNTGACTDGNPCTIGDSCSAGACIPGSGALPSAVQFCNNTAISIPTLGNATPYPSSIVVAGAQSYLCSVTVNLNGITHTFPDDIDVLLAHLAGPNAIIMSDVGGGTAATNVNLTLSDAAATSIPDAGPLVSGTFKPTNVNPGTGTEAWSAPAPAPSGGSALSAFTGTNPNGAWNLFVVDDETPDGGSFSGWCVNLVSVCTSNADCDDNNPCTDDACTNNTCSHTNNTVACNDNNACTATDTCTGGVCVGGPPPPCDDGNACTANTCNPGTGLCENPAIVCNDNNTCTDDTCNPSTGCVFTANDGNACTDNNLCTSPDVCISGACVGQNPVVCPSDGNVCTTEACVPATGNCVSTNNTNACDDGDACTTGDLCGPTFAENFDGETAPNLPGTWSSTVIGTGNLWSSVDTSSDTAPNSAFGFDGIAVADEVLVSPVINIVTASAKLTFRNRWSFESATSCFDAGVLEISIGGGAFTDIVTAGGSFVSGGYTGIVSSSFSNPLAARSAWCSVSAGYPSYLTTVVNIPAAAAGQTIQLQWRIGTDTSAGAPGQNIDSIVLVDGSNVCNPGTAASCDDSNPCTDDSCDSITGCQHSNNTEACDDGNACTVIDACSGGACGGTPVVCNDSNPCTLDSCNTGSGCVFTPITAPPETQNVAAAPDKATYTWSAAAFATRYDVVRGLLSALPVGPGGGDEVCFDDLAATTLNDATVPGNGTGFWYLSRGENSCGNGTYGNQGVNGAPGAPRISTTCP